MVAESPKANGRAALIFLLIIINADSIQIVQSAQPPRVSPYLALNATAPTMIYTVVILLLSSVLQAAASESVNSTSLGNVVEGNMTKFVRAMKRAKKEKKEEGRNNRKEVSIGDGADEAISSFVPNLRTAAVANSQDWNHGYFAVSAPKSGTIKVFFPKETQAGDMVFLFLSRTDGLLPLKIVGPEGWKRGVSANIHLARFTL